MTFVFLFQHNKIVIALFTKPRDLRLHGRTFYRTLTPFHGCTVENKPVDAKSQNPWPFRILNGLFASMERVCPVKWLQISHTISLLVLPDDVVLLFLDAKCKQKYIFGVYF